jgi:hypothetical protein
MITMLTIPKLIQINALYSAYTYQRKLLVTKDPRYNLGLATGLAKALEVLGLDLSGQEPPCGAGGEAVK